MDGWNGVHQQHCDASSRPRLDARLAGGVGRLAMVLGACPMPIGYWK